MPEALFRTAHLVKRFGGLLVTDDLSLEVRQGELHALIGPNGAGKTTALGQFFGELAQDAGEIWFDGQEISRLPTPARVRRGIARSFQITQLLPDYTALDNVTLAVQARQGHSFHFFRNVRADSALRVAAARHLETVGLGARADQPVASLSHGEQRQLELAVALAAEPRLLLLDEPMAGLGAAESRAMTELLAGLKGRLSMLLVEHDMEAVFALADRITVLVYGRAIATGRPEEIRRNPDVQAAYLAEETV